MRDTGRELRCLASVYNTIIRSKGQTMAENMELITVSGDDSEHAVLIRACADASRAEAEIFVSVDNRTRIVTITRQRESARVFSCALRMLADIGAYPEPDAADMLQMACERAARAVKLA